MNMYEMSSEELEKIEGGSVWKYIAAVGAIGFGAYEVYTGIGAPDGIKNICVGVMEIGGGLVTMCL
ncbi:unknown [Eubacterium sp. CAG:248]|nr:unknown [Eubacterium sp. CAG:248]